MLSDNWVISSFLSHYVERVSYQFHSHFILCSAFPLFPSTALREKYQPQQVPPLQPPRGLCKVVSALFQAGQERVLFRVGEREGKLGGLENNPSNSPIALFLYLYVPSYIYLEKEMATHSSIFVPGESHRQRSLVGYSPWGRKESDTTERLSTDLCYF